MSRRDEMDFDEPATLTRGREDRTSNNENGAAAAERARAGYTRLEENIGKEEWELPSRSELL